MAVYTVTHHVYYHMVFYFISKYNTSIGIGASLINACSLHLPVKQTIDSMNLAVFCDLTF